MNKLDQSTTSKKRARAIEVVKNHIAAGTPPIPNCPESPWTGDDFNPNQCLLDWDRHYALGDYVVDRKQEAETMNQLMRARGISNAGRVIDVGCGNSTLISRLNCVVGRYFDPCVRTPGKDLSNPPEDTFDLVVSANLLECVPMTELPDLFDVLDFWSPSRSFIHGIGLRESGDPKVKTVMPSEWWLGLLWDRYGEGDVHVHLTPDEGYGFFYRLRK